MSRMDAMNGLGPRTGGYPNRAGHVHGSRTSRAAARSVDHQLPRLEQVVLDILLSHGPCTDEEIQNHHTGFHVLRPRRIALLHKGLIEKTGEERLTRFGRKADCWQIVRAKP